jgi:hypothetical protein
MNKLMSEFYQVFGKMERKKPDEIDGIVRAFRFLAGLNDTISRQKLIEIIKECCPGEDVSPLL